MFPVHCERGHDLRGVEDGAPCPQCGSNRRFIEAAARTQAVATIRGIGKRQTIEENVRKHWPLIAAYIAFFLLSMILSYFLSGIPSVISTFVFGVILTVLGYYMITKVITKTWLD
jgi:uncharacterized membrane protein YfcA